MLFSSNTFLYIFLPIVLFGYFVVFHKTKARNYFLLLASLLFYAWGEPVCVFLMLLSVGVNYVLGLSIGRTEKRNIKRCWLLLSIVFNLGVLVYFKYLGFLIDNINNLFGLNMSPKDIRLPIGISFFTFQAMSYVIDVYRGKSEVQRNPLNLGIYISFFPQLIAGPIVRYNTIAEQISMRTVDLNKFQSGVCRFIQGFAKKIILSNMMAVVAEKGFELSQLGNISVAMAWLGSLAYTFQIFYDFSGYSDMAIGLGRMFGFEFEENFRYPYLSRSISEFWNRWHISLGHWFRDYVYFPMGGSRVGKWKLLRNLLAVWLLTGIWHGADWQFIFWGMGHGIIIVIEKMTGFPQNSKSKCAAVLYGIFTFLVVNMLWIFFGSPSFNAAFQQIGAMVGAGAAGIVDEAARYVVSGYLPYFLIAAFFSTPILGNIFGKMRQGTGYYLAQTVLHMALLLISVSFLAIGAHNPFIYFNF